MAIRNAKPITFRPKGLSDSEDGSNSFPGACSILQNLIPSAKTKSIFVPRPASTKLIDFVAGGFNAPQQPVVATILGVLVFGLIPTSRNASRDEPFVYNLLTAAFVTVNGITSVNTPTTQPTTGDWTPPTIAVIAQRVVVTHPGFTGGAHPFFGWFDISQFVSNTITGTTVSGSPTITTLNSNPITAGWEPGMTISGTNIPANSHVISMTASTVTIDNNASGSTGGVTLTVSGGTPVAPQWGAGNTNTNPLAAVPVAVEQFNGRAWYAVNNAVVFSDSGNPTQVTNASQALTAQTGVNFTALGPLGLLSTTTGGIVQSLIAFQGDSSMQQITGDSATSNLLMNNLNAPVGTLAPNTITSTPLGLAFISNDGLRIIDQYAKVSDPIGADGDGVAVPFINAVNPSRMVACYNQNVLRISVQNGAVQGQPVEEYWLDFTSKSWSGPHTFPASLIIANANTTNHGFLMAPNGITGSLWQSSAQSSLSDSFTENGLTMTCIMQPVLFPDNEAMSENAIVESTLMANLPAGSQLSILALDERQSPMDSIIISGSGQSATIWGQFSWGQAPWLGGQGFLEQRELPWTVPLIFKQMTVKMSIIAQSGLALGNQHHRYQGLGYTLHGTGT